MFNDYQNLIKTFDFTPMKQQIPVFSDSKNINDLKEAVIFDLDGTLAFNNGKRGWFDSDVSTDEICGIVKEQIKFHVKNNRKIFIVTGRDDKAEDSTIKWLDFNEIYYDRLYMRKFGDYRSDVEVKTEIYLNEFKDKYHIYLAYEDREILVQMYRKLGIKCFQVEWGRY